MTDEVGHDYKIVEDDLADDAFIGHWCHRVWSQETPDGLWYTVRETFYTNGETVDGYSSDATGVSGESVDELRQTLEWMKNALDKPVLRVEDYPSPQDDSEEEKRREAQMSETDVISTDVIPFDEEKYFKQIGEWAAEYDRDSAKMTQEEFDELYGDSEE